MHKCMYAAAAVIMTSNNALNTQFPSVKQHRGVFAGCSSGFFYEFKEGTYQTKSKDAFFFIKKGLFLDDQYSIINVCCC